MPDTKFILDSEKCIACGLCVADCFPGYITMGENGPVYPGSCMMCGHCAAVCPVNAITLPELDPETVMDYDEESFKVDPEKLLNSIRHRRSIRNYRSEKVSPEHLSLILEAGRCAPTASNTQKTRFIVVQEGLSEFKELLWSEMPAIIEGMKASDSPAASGLSRFLDHKNSGFRDDLFFNAPAYVLVITDNVWDAGLAASDMEMVAYACGAGMLHSGYLKRVVSSSPKLTGWLGINEGESIACCLLLGYPAVSYPRTAGRKMPKVTMK